MGAGPNCSIWTSGNIFHYEGDWSLAQVAQGVCGVSHSEDIQKPRGNAPWQLAVGGPVWAGALEQVPSRGPFQAHPFCVSVLLGSQVPVAVKGGGLFPSSQSCMPVTGNESGTVNISMCKWILLVQYFIKKYLCILQEIGSWNEFLPWGVKSEIVCDVSWFENERKQILRIFHSTL